MQNLELLVQPLDQKLHDFDKEKQNLYDQYDIKNKMTEQDLMLHQGIGHTRNPMYPEPQKTSKLFAIYSAELCN